MRSFIFVMLLCIPVCAYALPVPGDVVEVNWLGFTASEEVTVSSGLFYNGTYTAGVGEIELSDEQLVLDAFVIDLGDMLPNPAATYKAVELTGAPDPSDDNMSASKADAVEKLHSMAFAGIGNDTVKAAAFNVAVWEIVYENSGAWDVSSGDFLISDNAAVANQAQTYLVGLMQYNGDASELLALASPFEPYDFKLGQYSDLAIAVPEPATVVLLFSGAAVFALKRKS